MTRRRHNSKWAKREAQLSGTGHTHVVYSVGSLGMTPLWLAVAGSENICTTMFCSRHTHGFAAGFPQCDTRSA